MRAARIVQPCECPNPRSEAVECLATGQLFVIGLEFKSHSQQFGKNSVITACAMTEK